MHISIARLFKKEKYTIGCLYVDGQYVCDTLEDTDRGLTVAMSESEISKIKIAHETAIPTGTYTVDLDTVSPRFGNKPFFQELCGGKLPRLDKVPGFSGVLIHTGNTTADTDGCILLGYNKIKGGLIDSKVAFTKFYNLIKDQKDLILEIH